MKIKLLLPIVLFVNFCFSQNHFELKEASNTYDVKINVQTCENNECGGKAIIELIDKKTSTKIQTLTSDDLSFYLNEEQKPTANIIQVYNKQSPIIFNDFNFDGTEDLALRNGTESGYGGPSYDVYVYNMTKKQFVLSDELTILAHENLGMFNTDSERKRLITYSKSGCCWHVTQEYTVVPERGPLKVYEFEEDTRDPKTVITKRTEFADYKWVTKTTKYPREVYYKETKDENTEGN